MIKELTQQGIKSRIEKLFPAHVYNSMLEFGKIGDEMSYPVCLVGGIVRDLLLGKKNLDIDIVVEGDGIAFAGQLKKRPGREVVPFKKFNTATISFPEGFKVDVATARTETYRHPAALPEIHKSSIVEDLSRRDFSINAMAIRLNHNGFGRLIDCFNGIKELDTGVVRVLHDRSFIDDPTRIFRAVRYEQRYGFNIDPGTDSLMKNAIGQGLVGKLEGYRIRNELIALLNEGNAVKVLKRMAGYGLIEYIYTDIRLTDEIVKNIKRVSKKSDKLSVSTGQIEEVWLEKLLFLIKDLNRLQKKAFCRKMMFNSKYNNIILNT